MSLHRVLDYTIEDVRQAYMGIVGQGPAQNALVSVLSRDDFVSPFPRVRLAGWVPVPGQKPDLDKSALPKVLQDLPLFAGIEEMFAAEPDIILVLDLSPDSRHMGEVRSVAGPEVSLLSADMAIRLCSAFEEARAFAGDNDNPRKSQKLFALLVDQVKGDILILDREGVVRDVNQHAAKSRGLSPSQVIGLHCRELDQATEFCHCDENNCPFCITRDTGKQAQHTFSQILPNGRVRYVESVCYPVTDALGKPVLFLYIRRDVTEQHHLEQRLQQSEKMAAIGELSTYMAHEIRNPLFSIGGFANALLRNPSLNDIAREKARIIYEESRRLDIILTSILNFARPTEQEMDIFDVRTVAKQTVDLMTMGSEERGIASVIDIEAALPKVSGNAENLKQCLINLVKNAFEAMPAGGVFTLRASLNDNYVQIEIGDTGPGIPPEVQEQIFSPFFTTKRGGAGLGLAMTRKVIEEMGGQVFLESTPGKGTKVCLLVPVALAVVDAAQEASGPDQPTEDASAK